MILDEIVCKKKERLKENAYVFQLETFLERTKNCATPSFRKALQKEGLAIIGEIKKASPSRGVIREDFDPVALAKAYDGVVDCISVLTEEDFFQGSIHYLEQVRQTVSLPLLRKDFIISPLQILEAKEAGASCILLITAILEEQTLCDFLKLSHGLGLDAIVEVHNEEELRKALNAQPDIIGINNRNLWDFTESIQTTIELSKKIPDGIVVVSESSIHTAEDIQRLRCANIDAVLVGESFMRAPDISKKAKELRDAYAKQAKNMRT